MTSQAPGIDPLPAPAVPKAAPPGTDRHIAVVIADVDGTIVTSDKTLTPATIRAARDLGAEGVGLVLTSGRPPRGLEMLVEPLGLTQPLAAFNGGMYVTPDLAVIEQRPIPDGRLDRLWDLLSDRGVESWVYSGTRWYVRDANAPHVDREARTVGFEPTVVDDPGEVEGAVKITVVSDDGSEVRDTAGMLRSEFGESLSVTTSQPYYLDVTHPDANKGAVVEFVERTIGVERGRIAVLGDMENDVLMFSKAGLSIAMGNAASSVKARADRITGTNDHDGFAEAIDRFVLRAGSAEF